MQCAIDDKKFDKFSFLKCKQYPNPQIPAKDSLTESLIDVCFTLQMQGMFGFQ